MPDDGQDAVEASSKSDRADVGDQDESVHVPVGSSGVHTEVKD